MQLAPRLGTTEGNPQQAAGGNIFAEKTGDESYDSTAILRQAKNAAASQMVDFDKLAEAAARYFAKATMQPGTYDISEELIRELHRDDNEELSDCKVVAE